MEKTSSCKKRSSISFLLSLVMLFNVFAASFTTAITADTMSEPVQIPYGGEGGGAYQTIADADTSDSYTAVFDDDSNANDGRVWTDKTVKLGSGTESDEFSVTLSAMAQSVNVTREAVPSDTVFILDVSASMMEDAEQGKDDSRIFVMVEALNEAIEVLMEDNENNRIAVVAFGGHTSKGQTARAVPVLNLGRYGKDEGMVNDGEYFRMYSPGYVQVDEAILETAGFVLPNVDARTSEGRIRVFGGTSTQWGIREAAKILTDQQPEKKYGDGNEPPKPNIVLLTDGEPTFGWTDFTFSDPESSGIDGEGFSNGNGNIVQMGLEILTVLSASYFKQQISNHYYADDTAQKAGFYSIGLGIADSDDARATLNPAGIKEGSQMMNAAKISNAFDGTTYNMREVLDNFIRGGEASFPAIMKRAGDREVVTVTYPDNISPKDRMLSYHYADFYGEASTIEELNQFFETITSRITSQGDYATSVIDDPAGMYESAHTSYADYSGAVVFSDVIGEFMEFKGFDHLLYKDTQYNGAIFAQRIKQENPNGGLENPDGATTRKALNTLFASQLFFRNITGTHGTEEEVEAIVEALLESCLAAGDGGDFPDESGVYYDNAQAFGNRIRFYADENGTWVGNYFENGRPVSELPVGACCLVDQYYVNGAAHNTVSGNPSDLTYSIFEVITALENGADVIEANFTVDPDDNEIHHHTVAMRKLEPGQQMTRWIIPASLLPLRSVKTEENGEESTVVPTTPIRFVYSVGLRRDFSPENPALADYKDENEYKFYTNAWRDDFTALSHNDALAHFIPGIENTYYHPGLTEDTADYGGVNNTETDGYATGSPNEDHSPVRFYPLGNNGRLEVPVTTLTVTKSWDDTLVAEPVYVQLYRNGSALGEPKLIAPDTTESWDDPLLLYEPEADTGGNAKPVQYLIKEGTWDGSAFTPYNEDHTDFTIFYGQPVWDPGSNSMTATVENVSKSHDKEWFLKIQKDFDSPELEAELRRQNVSIEFIPLVSFVKPDDTTTGFSPVSVEGSATESMTIRYPDDFINGACNVWLRVIDGATPPPSMTMNVLLVEKKAAIDGFEWSNPTSANAAVAPEATNEAMKQFMIDANAGNVTSDDTIYCFGVQNVMAGTVNNTAAFEITNHLTPIVPPTASLTLQKEVEGIGEEDFAATFVIEGWEDKTAVNSRDLGKRVYYESVEYKDLPVTYNNLPLPDDNEDYYYTVTENAADTIRKDALHVYQRDLTYDGDTIDDENTDDNTVGFFLNRDDDTKTIGIDLTNTYHRELPPGVLTIEKALVGEYTESGVNNDTVFLARVKNADSEEYLKFDADHIYIGADADDGYDISFSKNTPVVFTGIPNGTYIIEEQSGSAYTMSYTVDGTVTNEAQLNTTDEEKTVVVTNTYHPELPPGVLTIEKVLAGEYTAQGVNNDTVFWARVKNADSEEYLNFDADHIYTGADADDGYDISFSKNTPVVLTGIPNGTYIIEEQSGSAYTMSYTVDGTVTNEAQLNTTDEEKTVVVTNTYHPEVPPGALTIEKALVGEYTAQGVNNDTVFLARVKNADSEEYLNFDADHIYTGADADDGYDISFSKNTPVVLTGIPNGTYIIEEQSGSAYTMSYTVDGTVTNEAQLNTTDEEKTVVVTNTYHPEVPPGVLTIEKALVGEYTESGVNNDTVFLARVKNADSETYLNFDADHIYTGADADDGYDISFSKNTPVVLTGIPNGTYIIEEQSGSAYTMSYTVDGTVTNEAQLNTTDEEKTVVVTNTYHPEVPPGVLTIEKALAGEYTESGVNNDTVFLARVKNAGSETYLNFDADHIYIGADADDGYDISFSKNTPVVLTGISNGIYIIEEQSGSAYTMSYTVDGTVTNEARLNTTDEEKTVVVTNTYPGTHPEDDPPSGGNNPPGGGNNPPGGGNNPPDSSPPISSSNIPGGGNPPSGGNPPEGGNPPSGGNPPEGGNSPSGGNPPGGGNSPSGGNPPGDGTPQDSVVPPNHNNDDHTVDNDKAPVSGATLTFYMNKSNPKTGNNDNNNWWLTVLLFSVFEVASILKWRGWQKKRGTW